MYHKKKINIVSNSHNPKGLLHTAPQTTINTSLDLGNVWHFCLRKNEQNDQSIVNQNSCQLIFSPKLYFKVNYLCKVSWKKNVKNVTQVIVRTIWYWVWPEEYIVPLPLPRPLLPRPREPLALGQFLIQCPERPHPKHSLLPPHSII